MHCVPYPIKVYGCLLLCNHSYLYLFRKYCYKCLTDCLQRLLAVRQSPHQSPSLPSRPGPPPAPDPNELTPEDADKYVSTTEKLYLYCGCLVCCLGSLATVQPNLNSS